MVREIQDEIIRIKKEKGICILAHSYQAHEIMEIADYTGDSFQLSLAGKEAREDTVLMCGVHFMAETVKLLSPQKKVLLVHPEAGCPMADQVGPEFVEHFREQNPGYTVVCYINTTAALKTACDVCVTSTAVKIVNNIENENILFLPDGNLGDYVSRQVRGKNIRLFQGGCPIHAAVRAEDVAAARKAPQRAGAGPSRVRPRRGGHGRLCGIDLRIMDYARKSDAREFIIGTENSIAEHLSYELPDKEFYALSKKMLCPNMKLTTLMDVYKVLQGQGGLEIDMDPDTMVRAKRCIDEMVRLGK